MKLPDTLDVLLDPWPMLFWSVVGVVLSALWQRFRKRLTTLRWYYQNQPLAVSASDPTYGRIEVRYNDVPLESLVLCSISIKNESSKDLTDVEIRFRVPDDATILGIAGNIEGSTKGFPMTDEFVTLATEVISNPEPKNDDPKVIHVRTTRDLLIPVLNRDAVAQVALLLSSGHDVQPTLSCDHKGVRLVPQKAPRWFQAQVLGVPLSRASAVGLLVGVVGTVIAVQSTDSVGLSATVAFVLASAASLVGAVICRAWSALLRWLG